MKLVELVPGEKTEAEVTRALAGFLSEQLGKGVVWAKDTVNFIANRIGCFWLLAGLLEGDAVLDEGYDIEDIDAAMGAPLGVPPTGLYGLVDLVGLDVLGLVIENLKQNLPADDAGRAYLKFPAPVQRMLENRQIGRKVGAGFYRMSKTEDGGRLKETFDLKSESWRVAKTAALDPAHQSLEGLLTADDALGRFAWTVMGGTALYAADLVPDISEDVVNVDRAMRWGFNWRQGPFEIIDALGADAVIARLEAEGRPLPKMLQVLREAGAKSFYRNDGKEFLGVDGQYHPVP
jgi:3-hydroxyacyl-CoA dehydrogenase